ncbi:MULTISPECIES: DUF4832 domain-containing protein [unclassified Actinomyces]|uniref:DUF4832 domain-containing protein n=1 Tax=unclassified Actinomyces TaxID=2609248 RepID=UPI0020180E9D|nr:MULTISPECIES: DUF4832 domain-containing protein [unclassified Actinomyces]MCL3777874.1 DUF4832 domain-containing protein [Actinomyces sp. AC-20-1]MCL3789245.1 DUF4832 domain-containing protein [Actinomyces sp. 187325]MCL3791598.1 DUF4832 domain-containing protein [Actinomyces sp. 186855]MCL3793540.1 DUF4832 domain-containing protein [Actinomyces sp. 217892]
MLAALLLLALVPTALTACAPGPAWTRLDPAAAPVSNPLKGLLPYAPEDPAQAPTWSGTALPVTMEWVSLPVSDVVTGPGTYDWDALEEHLGAVAARGHQVVLRFYTDFPGRPSGLPGYLLDQGVETRPYTVHGNGGTGASVSPDYDDPRVMDMLTGLIRALGSAYDGDPRVGFITQGLVGFWGEGHTWPFDGQVSADNPAGEDWMPSRDHQALLLLAWDEAFDTTPTQVRYPTALTTAHDLGYHDDSFGYATLPEQDWHFWSLMSAQGPTATGAWRTRPMGGEIYPPLQSCVFDGPGRCERQVGLAAQDLTEAVGLTHATWLLAEEVFDPGLTGPARERALALNARMGYTLTATRWRHEAGTSALGVEVSNTGVAPFSYDWDLEVVAVDGSGRVLARTVLDGDLRALLPGRTSLWTGALDPPSGTTSLLLRVVNPLEGGAALRFANAGQDTVLPGYLTLGPPSG